MSVVKVLNLLGSSNESWENAVSVALDEANRTVKNITGFEVLNTTGVVQDGKISEYKANINVAFRVDNGN